MRSGAGALKVEGSVAQKFNIASEVTKATKWTPTTQHCQAEEVQWNTYHNPYLPMQEWME